MNQRSQASARSRRLHIDRLTLDLRGQPPELAAALAQALGPALESALVGRSTHVAPARHVDGGRLSAGAKPDGGALAQQIAERIVGAAGGG